VNIFKTIKDKLFYLYIDKVINRDDSSQDPVPAKVEESIPEPKPAPVKKAGRPKSVEPKVPADGGKTPAKKTVAKKTAPKK
jgi:hypothetical protein